MTQPSGPPAGAAGPAREGADEGVGVRPDDDRPGDGRFETEAQRADRQWIDLLQELRVTQAGTQILTGFLLAIAFQPRFRTLDDWQTVLYLVLVALSALSTIVGLAPVSLHRAVFGLLIKSRTVVVGDRLLIVQLVVVSLITAGVASLLFDVTLGRTAGLVAAAGSLVLLVLLWLLLPLAVRRRRERTAAGAP